MKYLFLSAVGALLAVGSVASAVGAEQVSLNDPRADINGDGRVTLTEVKNYNRDQRQS